MSSLSVYLLPVRLFHYPPPCFQAGLARRHHLLDNPFRGVPALSSRVHEPLGHSKWNMPIRSANRANLMGEWGHWGLKVIYLLQVDGKGDDSASTRKQIGHAEQKISS